MRQGWLHSQWLFPAVTAASRKCWQMCAICFLTCHYQFTPSLSHDKGVLFRVVGLWRYSWHVYSAATHRLAYIILSLEFHKVAGILESSFYCMRVTLSGLQGDLLQI